MKSVPLFFAGVSYDSDVYSHPFEVWQPGNTRRQQQTARDGNRSQRYRDSLAYHDYC